MRSVNNRSDFVASFADYIKLIVIAIVDWSVSINYFIFIRTNKFHLSFIRRINFGLSDADVSSM